MGPSGEPVAEVGTSSPARRRHAFAVTAAVVTALVLAVIVYRWDTGGTPRALPSPSPSPSASGPLSTAEVYAALAPSVVVIEATGEGTSTGTGVVASADGVILTALHVIAGADSIRVTFADGTPSEATVFAVDSSIDIAVLAVTTLPTVLVPAVIGNSGRLSIGDDVVAIGNQLGLTSSATAGVISGLNRAATGEDGTRLSGLIQFDAAVNPGSSGGPLVNTKSETIGIIVALANPTGAKTFIGIGFAVPIGAALGAGGDGSGPQQ